MLGHSQSDIGSAVLLLVFFLELAVGVLLLLDFADDVLYLGVVDFLRASGRTCHLPLNLLQPRAR